MEIRCQSANAVPGTAYGRLKPVNGQYFDVLECRDAITHLSKRNSSIYVIHKQLTEAIARL
jgi:hypothetical protein